MGSYALKPSATLESAKYSRALIQRIYQHVAEEAWLKAGQTILDPFAGVGLGAWDAINQGYNYYGIELERAFVDCASGCDCTGITPADWRRFSGRFAKARYLDGRHWCPACMQTVTQVTGERTPTRRTFRTASGTTRTVLYAPLPFPDRRDGVKPHRPAQTHSLWDMPTPSYGRSSGVIPSSRPHHYQGNLEKWARLGSGTGRVVQGDSRRLREILAEQMGLCVGSPPYAASDQNYAAGWGRIALEKGVHQRHSVQMESSYGRTPSNLANLPPGPPPPAPACAIASPPYADGCTHTGGADPQPQYVQGGTVRQVAYGTSAGQLANMVVSSPPYEDSELSDNRTTFNAMLRGIGRHDARTDTARTFLPLMGAYTTQGTLGQTHGDTFWSAAAQIVQAAFDVLTPGGHAIFVVKNYVRDGIEVDFTGDWARLCQACGFEWLHWHQALLTEEHGVQRDLLGGADHVHSTKRVSFFRRLAEKRGSPAILFESVLCFRKPGGPASENGVTCAISSPPWQDQEPSHAQRETPSSRRLRAEPPATRGQAFLDAAYGSSPGQLGAMPPGTPPGPEGG